MPVGSVSPGRYERPEQAPPEPEPVVVPRFTVDSLKTFTSDRTGRIARRRIETLLKFDCRIRVVATEALPEIVAYAEDEKLELRIKPYEPSDLAGADYVLAASNDSELNHEIYIKCKETHVPVNVADDKTKSDFYFPGIIRKRGITAGVTAEGKDHGLRKERRGRLPVAWTAVCRRLKKIETGKNKNQNRKQGKQAGVIQTEMIMNLIRTAHPEIDRNWSP